MTSKNSKRYINPHYVGVIGSVSLFSVYFLIVSIIESTAHAIEQFTNLWYLIGPLVLGFGIQVGLFYYIRAELKIRKAQNASKSVVASGGVSTASMIACCAHHITDVLPILGLSAAAMFLSNYQIFFMVLGVVSNIFGIVLMLEIIKKHGLAKKEGALAWFFDFNLGRIRNWVVFFSIILLGFTAYNTA